MKKIITRHLFIILILSHSGCVEDNIDMVRLERSRNVSTIITSEEVLDKKGIGMGYKIPTWSSRVARLKPFWHYAWNKELNEAIPDSVEFVPMIWGKNSLNNEALENLKNLRETGQIKHVLGFNEPDLETQSHMSVDEAIALWPKLEEIGVPLGSPAPAGLRNGWLEEFMLKAEQNNLRVDFICIHLYLNNNPQLFLDMIDETYNKYNKPIWITEMAVVDNQATSIDNNKYSPIQILGTMRTLLPELYNRKYVHRFAWFNGTESSPNYPRLYSSRLYNDDESMTELGEYYANYKPNMLAGSGKDPVIEEVTEVPGNLLKNGTFESGSISPWGGFKNAVLNASVQDPNTGNFLARIEPHDGSIFQIIDVEEGKSYSYSFFHRWKTTPTNTFNAVIKNNEGDEEKFVDYEVPMTNEWTENNIEFTVPAGVSKAKVVFYKPLKDPMLPGFFLDDVVILKKP